MAVKKKEPMKKQEAQEIFEAAIRRYMETNKVSYNAAVYALQRERPALVEGYTTVTRRIEK